VSFGHFVLVVEVATVTTESFREAESGPVGGFINGAFVGLRIAETLGEQGGVSMVGLPALGQGFQGESEAAGGEVGPSGLLHNEETPHLHDEREAISPGNGVPADPLVAVLEAGSGTRPAEGGHELVAAAFGVTFIDSLPEGVAGGPACPQAMLGVEKIAQGLDFRLGASIPDHEFTALALHPIDWY
jgi:hypothetical protein